MLTRRAAAAVAGDGRIRRLARTAARRYLVAWCFVAAAVAGAVVPPHAWPALIALALFGANRALGNAATLAVCAAGQVIGTLVSEGIVAYRVDSADLPVSYRYLVDIGPSYVVVAAIVAALIAGSWPARAAAALDLALLVFAGHIFSGLTGLDVAAAGHLTALVTAAGAVLLMHRRAWHESMRELTM